MNEKKCIVCNDYLQNLLEFENMPSSAQQIPDKDELDKDKPFTLELCQCKGCGLVQINTEPVGYYKDVIRAGGGSSTMKNLRQEEYKRLLAIMNSNGLTGKRIIEIGCGRGEFMKMWEGIDPQLEIHGIEHNPRLVKKALDDGLDVTLEFAENEEVKLGGAPYDAFVQFNFLEHQPKPLEMLKCIYNNIKDGAVGLVTVPSLEYILEHDGYYELIRDHIAYYDERTLKELFEKAKFKVIDERVVNRDTIEIIVEKAKESMFDQSAFNGEYINFKPLEDNYLIIRKDFEEYINQLEETNRTIAMWGAGHQGFTLAATTEMLGKVRYIIDSAKFKQGRFAPVSHVPIVSPDHFFDDPVDEILIVAPGYTDEIAGIIRKKYGIKVKIIVLRTERIEDYD